MSKCENNVCCGSSVNLYFSGILAAYALLVLFFIIPKLLGGSLFVTIIVVIIAAILVLFALAIILKGLCTLLSSLHR